LLQPREANHGSNPDRVAPAGGTVVVVAAVAGVAGQ